MSSEQDLAAQQEQADVDLCLESVYAKANIPEKAELIGAPEITTSANSREIRGKIKLTGGTGTVVPYFYVCVITNSVVVKSVVLPA